MATRSHSGERGQALAEFALVLPIVVLLMVGLLDLGRVVFINNSLSDGARHGARHAATDPRAPGYCADVEKQIRSAIRSQPLAAARVEYQLVNTQGLDDGATHVLCQLDGSGSLVNGPGQGTLPPSTTTHPGRDRITVVLEASVDLATPFVAAATGQPTFELSAASTMVVTFAP